MHLSELRRMGARVELEGATAILHGVESPQWRASDGLGFARLGGVGAGRIWWRGGTTEVNRVYHIDRGLRAY